MRLARTAFTFRFSKPLRLACTAFRFRFSKPLRLACTAFTFRFSKLLRLPCTAFTLALYMCVLCRVARDGPDISTHALRERTRFSPDINVNLEHYGESVNAHTQFRHPRSCFSNTFTELLSPETGLAVGDCNVTKYGNTSLTLTKVPRSDSKHLKQLRMHKVRHSHRQLHRRGWFFGT